MAIHLVQRARAFAACKSVAADSDCIVLIGEGVVAGLQGAAGCFASAQDVSERGVGDKLPSDVVLIDDTELVALCATHSPVVSWSQP